MKSYTSTGLRRSWSVDHKNDFYSSKKDSKIYKYMSVIIVHRLFLFVIRFLAARWMLFILQIQYNPNNSNPR